MNRQRGGKLTSFTRKTQMGSKSSLGPAGFSSRARRVMCPSDPASGGTGIASRGMGKDSLTREPACNLSCWVTPAAPETDQNGDPRRSNSVSNSIGLSLDASSDEKDSQAACAEAALMLLTEAALSRLASSDVSAADPKEAKKQISEFTVLDPSFDLQEKFSSSTVNECTMEEMEREDKTVKPVIVLPAIVPRKRGQRSIMSCPKCGNEYNRADALRMHYASVHQKEKRFQCPDCGKRFGWKESVRRHRAAMHSANDSKSCRPRRKPQLWHGQQLVPDSKLEECNKQARPLPPNVTARLL